MDKENRLLLFLLSNYEELLNVREIARRTGVRKSTASRVLNGLYSKDVLVRKAVGNQVFYSLNTQNPLTLNMCALAYSLKYRELKLSSSHSKQISSFVDSCIKSLGEGLLSIVLYGSIARGEAGKTSDVDILVILRSLEESDKVETIAQGINASYTSTISPTTVTLNSFAAELKAENMLYLKIVKEGIPIFGTETYLREIFKFMEGKR